MLNQTPARTKCRLARRSLALGALFTLISLATPPAAAQSAPPDAVIDLWEQHWTLNADGSTVYHEKKHVRLNNDRANGAFADPRIAFNRDTDQVDILVARTKRPDGSYVDVPSYARNEVSPGGDAGWPAFASLRHLVLTMSAIEPGCIVELEYRIQRKPRPTRFFAADLRLDDRYPIQSRVISLERPEGSTLNIYIPNDVAAAVKGRLEKVAQRHALLQSWNFGPQPAAPSEGYAPDWRTRPGRRFAFSTAGSVDAWRKAALERVVAAADDSPLLKRLAAEWTRDQADDGDKLRALQEKLAATFNFVDLAPDQRPAIIRPASVTLESNYGQPEEATAVLLALARAVGLPARAALVVDHDTWLEDTPQDAFISAYAVELGPGADDPRFDPRRGRITRDTRYAGARVLHEDGTASDVPAWTDASESRLDLTGRLQIEADGKAAGAITVRAGGLFAPAEALRTRAEQERRVRELTERLLLKMKVSDVSIVSLTPTSFEAKAKIERTEPLEKLDGAFILELPAAEPFELIVGLPLGSARRESAVELPGAFEQRTSLTIAWPEGWKLDAAPQDRPVASFAAGSVAQTISRKGDAPSNELTIGRSITLGKALVEPKDFELLHAALTELRSAAQRTVVWKP